MENERLILKELGFSVYKLAKENAHKWVIQILSQVFGVFENSSGSKPWI